MEETKDAYQEYVDSRRKKEEESPPEDTAERRVELNLGLRDVVVLLDLIKENSFRYGANDLAKLNRVETRLRMALHG